jgi:pimeloyl-ACP methyl ester carboxylesterase
VGVACGRSRPLGAVWRLSLAIKDRGLTQLPAFRGTSRTFHYLDVGSGFPVVFHRGPDGDADDLANEFVPPAGIRLLSLEDPGALAPVRVAGRAHARPVPFGGPCSTPFDRHGDDLVALLDHLRLPSAIVGGTSVGAAVALNVAVRYPERVAGLVLSRPAWLDGPLPDYVLDLFDRIAGLLREPSPTELRRPGSLPRLEQCAPLDPLPDLSSIRVPTLVLAHHQDPVHPFHYGMAHARAIPGARFDRLTPSGLDRRRQTDEIQHALTAFLEWYSVRPVALEEVA